MRKLTATLAVAGLTATGVLALSAPATARGGDDVRVSGACSTGGVWKLKVKSDDGGLEVEGEVNTNVAGQSFAWTFRDNGVVVAKGRSTTAGPSGSFSVERLVADRPGTDRVTFRAVRVGGGQVCAGTLAY